MKKFLLMFLVGCGVQNHDDNSGLNLTENKSQEAPYTLYLDSKADMPECIPSNKRQLIYIKEETKFYVCDDKEWLAVEIKAEKASTAIATATATAVEASPLATAQVNTVTVTNTVINTVIERPVLTSDSKIIIDRTNGDMWFLGSTYKASEMASIEALCPKGSRSPSEEESRLAFENGMIHAYSIIEGANSFWIGLNQSILFGGYRGNDYIVDLDSALTKEEKEAISKRALCLIKP